MTVHLSVVGPDEYSQSQARLKEWSYGNEVDNVTLMRLSVAASWHYGRSRNVATETDTDFFDTLCEFNFSLFTRVVDDIILHSFMEFMHIWVSSFSNLFSSIVNAKP